MTKLRRTLYLLASAVLLSGTSAGPSLAQQAPAQQPQQTTASYEDWIVRCVTVQGPPARKSCEMAQNNTQANGGGVISQLVIGRAAKTDPLKAVVLLPLGVWLPTGVKLTADARDPGLLATFKHCQPQACFADVELSNDAQRRYRAMTERGQIQFKDGSQKDMTLPISFKGFGTALDALAKE